MGNVQLEKHTKLQMQVAKDGKLSRALPALRLVALRRVPGGTRCPE